MKIKSILKQALLTIPPNLMNHYVTNIVNHTSYVKKNSVFFAIQGTNSAGEDYIEKAINLGAKTIVTELPVCKQENDINYICVSSTRVYYAKFLKVFYHDISKKMILIGVTGTNGKTTLTSLLFDFFSYQGKKAMKIGTHSILIQNKSYQIKETTPDLYIIYEALEKAYKQNVRYVLIEASSQGIAQQRLLGLSFRIGIFTNLSEEHLDFHHSIEKYREAKSDFLAQIKPSKKNLVIVNLDDPSSILLLPKILAPVETMSIKYQNADAYAFDLHQTRTKGFQCDVILKNKRYHLQNYSLCDFSIYHDLSSLLALTHLGFSVYSFLGFLRIAPEIPGRLQTFVQANRTIIIDYAHTKASVEEVIKNCKLWSMGKVYVVIGCGGNREKEKRSQIAKACCQNADFVYFTEDNSRDEDTKDILIDMTSQLTAVNFEMIMDRREAIHKAVFQSESGSLIMILGKGSETSIEKNGIMTPFSDIVVVKEELRSFMDKENQNENNTVL